MYHHILFCWAVAGLSAHIHYCTVLCFVRAVRGLPLVASASPLHRHSAAIHTATIPTARVTRHALRTCISSILRMQKYTL